MLAIFADVIVLDRLHEGRHMYSSYKIGVLSCIIRGAFGNKLFFITSSECFTPVPNIPVYRNICMHKDLHM